MIYFYCSIDWLNGVYAAFNIKSVLSRQINIGKLLVFVNHKLPTIHSESVPRSESKASKYSYSDGFWQMEQWLLYLALGMIKPLLHNADFW